MTREVEVTITVAYEDYDKDVECMCLLKSFKGGIGRNECFGSIDYDEYTGWEMYECLPWEFDEIIDAYIKDQWDVIESMAMCRM